MELMELPFLGDPPLLSNNITNTNYSNRISTATTGRALVLHLKDRKERK